VGDREDGNELIWGSDICEECNMGVLNKDNVPFLARDIVDEVQMSFGRFVKVDLWN
jgi:hypothetical protein